ncbi:MULTISPECIES: response regulator [Stenotrophomonas]|jgi:CheY-like chemotaxis protein|uniref:Response regulator n=2 Tax=Stenotrophomonas TaxID=40323 RepID=A0A246HJ61_STEMA|nr:MULTISPECIES: response regulator [Stenotrophomonas]AOX61039.1 two-component system response regulator [Stenotrophomonas sp. LM091]MBW8375250.1 response regulator [Stenotrophomonas sp.]MCX2919765.1 response regulator [Stenotrophomonas rhizophila]OFS89832.1 two-component system response regulator [Stenotrophomonas sp. HMSC10F06]OWQ50887.1 response regulator [Stenotrophomonas maltophilia]
MRDLRPILLVEDNPKDAELTMAALARCQLLNDVTHVRDGVEALEYLRCQGRYEGAMHGGPVVVLLDLKLPKLNGLEVLKEIRTDRALSSTPVVMLTSSREEQDLIRSYELGVNAFVVKPVDFKEFLEAIQGLGMFWGITNQPPPHGTLFGGKSRHDG